MPRRGYVLAAVLLASAVVASCDETPSEPLAPTLTTPGVTDEPPAFNTAALGNYDVLTFAGNATT